MHKKLMEKRAELMEKMEGLLKTADAEERSLTEDEQKEFDACKKEVDGIDATIAADDSVRTLTKRSEPKKSVEGGEGLTTEELELRTFANVIRNRADANITKTENGVIIPKTIANKIIDKVVDISPLFGRAEKYNIKGEVAIPYVDSSADNITVAYADEFVDLEAKSTKLQTVNLSSYLTGALAKVSISLLNSTDIDLVNFVIGKIAMSVATFLDKAILVGDEKIKGISEATQKVEIGATISADLLIDMRNTLKSPFQSGAIWVMAPATLTAVQKLKDGNGRYLFNDNIVNGFSGSILGKPVYTSDQAPALGEDGAIVYIDPAQALATKMVEDSLQILRERYATQHAIGVVEWLEADAKIQNQQAVVRSAATKG